MTAGLLPLFLLWLYDHRQGGAQPPPMQPLPGAPPWPTPSSPPPLPAFHPTSTPHSADPSHVSTPLADLHNNPPEVPHTPASPSDLKSKATSAAKSAAMNALRGKLRSAASLTPIDPWGSPNTSVPVAKLQEVINSRGGKLKRDGLYGPKTAAAWSKLASSKGYPPTIKRVNANTAQVSSRAYHALGVPPIP